MQINIIVTVTSIDRSIFYNRFEMYNVHLLSNSLLVLFVHDTKNNIKSNIKTNEINVCSYL